MLPMYVSVFSMSCTQNMSCDMMLVTKLVLKIELTTADKNVM